MAGGDWSPWCEFTVAEKTTDEEAAGSTESVRVTLPGRNWALVVDRLAQRASQDEEPEYWAVVGALSSALGGHPHPTMGLPRPAPEESA
ncbi:hypothetical protein BC793_1064 [Actinoplanes xinjiangensis]|uniref:Uncharacterized protein n=1 Tax=Actinoplanes xinjiangensis TaxID=512350 RepID=A0A316G0V1_9ACTN|nr:hypothetical protein BC793_1064 [Actinoplanes xinjiangensis]